MLFTTFTVEDKEYKLRLNTRSTIELENKLGTNPLGIFGSGDTVPTITNMVNILHASLQAYHHGITINDTFGIFDKYLESHNQTDFIPVILDIYKCSGIIPNEDEPKN